MAELIEPKETEINGRTFVISKFNAVDGREIITQYPLSGMPKLGDYKTNEGLMLKIMSFAEAKTESGINIRLSTKELVNNHCGDWETLIKLEWEMIQYNCSFFQDGKSADFFQRLTSLAEQKITEMLTRLSGGLLQAEKRRSGSSKTSTV
jgi:hypothetical protein